MTEISSRTDPPRPAMAAPMAPDSRRQGPRALLARLLGGAAVQAERRARARWDNEGGAIPRTQA